MAPSPLGGVEWRCLISRVLTSYRPHVSRVSKTNHCETVVLIDRNAKTTGATGQGLFRESANFAPSALYIIASNNPPQDLRDYFIAQGGPFRPEAGHNSPA